MTPTALQRWIPRARLGGRRGSLIVTAFIIVIGMTVVVGGIHTMLKNQLDNAITLKDISFAKLQAIYVAEMGVNHVMYQANSGTISSTNSCATVGAGGQFQVDFSGNVALTRGGTDGRYARCTIYRSAANTYQVTGTIYIPNVTPSSGYSKVATFQCEYDNPVWKLTSYQMN